MAKTAFVFPGQGSQSVGMGKDLYDKFSEAREIFNTADEILGFALSELCFEGPEDELRLTSNTQPAIFTASVACLRILECQGLAPEVTAGHSIGEYTALVAAKAVSFESALPLVRKRGELMQEAGVKQPGTMAAVIGLDIEKVTEICEKARGVGIVDVANYNSPGQVVISGEVEAVNAALEYAKEAGARKVMPLNVSGAFHSRLMASATEKLTEELNRTEFTDSAIPVVANVTADYVRTASEIRDTLARQIAGSVLWDKSVAKMTADGINCFVEVGPGKTLAGLIKRIDSSAEVRNAGNASAFE